MSLTAIASQCVALNYITVGNDYFMTLSRGAVFKSPGMWVGDGIWVHVVKIQENMLKLIWSDVTKCLVKVALWKLMWMMWPSALLELMWSDTGECLVKVTVKWRDQACF